MNLLGNKIKNVLLSDVEIHGSIKLSNDFVIDGKVEGDVSSEGNLTIGDHGECLGEVKAHSVVVYGKVLGDITVADICVLKPDAVIEGDIVAGAIAIEDGAVFRGTISVGKRPPANEFKPASSSSHEEADLVEEAV